jgi:hypothetical protein
MPDILRFYHRVMAVKEKRVGLRDLWSWLTKRSRKMPDVAVVGDSKIHKRFLDSHISFLREFGEVQKLDDKMRDRALEKYNQPPQRSQKVKS